MDKLNMQTTNVVDENIKRIGAKLHRKFYSDTFYSEEFILLTHIYWETS